MLGIGTLPIETVKASAGALALSGAIQLVNGWTAFSEQSYYSRLLKICNVCLTCEMAGTILFERLGEPNAHIGH